MLFLYQTTLNETKNPHFDVLSSLMVVYQCVLTAIHKVKNVVIKSR